MNDTKDMSIKGDCSAAAIEDEHNKFSEWVMWAQEPAIEELVVEGKLYILTKIRLEISSLRAKAS